MKKLLIIDDDQIVIKSISSQFDSNHVIVSSANNGESGLDLAIKEHPDLILLDLVMPKMDGMTMLRLLRQDDWGKTANVVILTNLSDQEKVAEVVDEQSYDYLVKVNWNVNDVVNLIKKKLDIL